MKVAYALLFLVAGCEVGSAGDGDEDTDVAEEPVDVGFSAHASQPYSTTGTPSPSSDFNFNGMHNDQCVHLTGIAQLRFADGTPNGYVLDPSTLKFNPLRRPVDDSSGNPCPDGSVQLDVQEHIHTAGKTLLFQRGGFPYSPAGNVKYGHLLASDLTSVPAARKTQANGVECGASHNPSTEATYTIRPTTLPAVLSFRKSKYAECVATAKANHDPLTVCTNGYESYGDPGYDQGDFTPAERHHYTYLLWNFVNVAGGGVVRADLGGTETFHRCNVRAIKQIAYSDDGKQEIGWVKAIYGKTSIGGNWLYGWIVHSHHCNAGVAGCPAGTVFHVQ